MNYLEDKNNMDGIDSTNESLNNTFKTAHKISDAFLTSVEVLHYLALVAAALGMGGYIAYSAHDSLTRERFNNKTAKESNNQDMHYIKETVSLDDLSISYDDDSLIKIPEGYEIYSITPSDKESNSYDVTFVNSSTVEYTLDDETSQLEYEEIDEEYGNNGYSDNFALQYTINHNIHGLY